MKGIATTTVLNGSDLSYEKKNIWTWETTYLDSLLGKPVTYSPGSEQTTAKDMMMVINEDKF